MRKGAEYRSSPVLALGKNACYLNLDLTDYLRWRLEPDAQRAAATRRALLDAGLKKCRDECLVDWAKSSLPPGTQIARLALGKAPRPGFILALRRNPQARLNELGGDGDSNAVFEKPEAFKLVLREKCWLGQSLPSTFNIQQSKPESVSTLEGTLDPVTPKIFILYQDEPAQLSVKLPAAANKLAAISVAIDAAAENSESALYKIRVLGPDEREREHYGALVFSRDGALAHSFIPALNDPSGTWTVHVQNLTSGASAAREITINDDE